jgi:hypothetical protein
MISDGELRVYWQATYARRQFRDFSFSLIRPIFLAHFTEGSMTKFRRLGCSYSQDCGRRDLVRVNCGVPLNGLSRFALAVFAALFMTGVVAAAQRPKAADEQLIASAVESYFASVPGYMKGDLISQSQIERALSEIKRAGATVQHGDAIIRRGLTDDSFLARELSTPAGRRFMRKLAHIPNAFSRLDRLSTIPRGEKLIHDLVRQKDGDKMIEYLATTKGGRNMGSMMAQVRGGVDLNTPTGRIYTADDLIAALNADMHR